MPNTEDDLRPFGRGGEFNPVAAARTTARIFKILWPVVTTIAAALGGTAVYRAEHARQKADETSGLTSVGYETTLRKVNEHEVELHDLQQHVRELELQRSVAPPRRVVSRRGPEPAKIDPIKVSAVKTLPKDLTQAAVQLAKPVPAPAPTPDAGPTPQP